MDNKSKTVYGSIELISSLTGLAFNGIALPYFVSRCENFSNILYILIVVTDMFTCVVCIPSALSFLIESFPVLSDVQWPCTLIGIIFNTTARFSVFLIAVLSVCRTISLIFPFRKMNQSVVGSVTIAIYFILLLFQAFLPILFSETGYFYIDDFGMCTWLIESLNFVDGYQSPTYAGLFYAFIIVPWLLPGIVVLISGGITTWRLLKSHQTAQSLGSSSTTQTKRATITVVIVTTLYILLNTPCWVFFLSIILNYNKSLDWHRSAVGFHMNYFSSKLSVELNAACNPFVYILRMKVVDINTITRLVRARNVIQQKVRMFVNYMTTSAGQFPPMNEGNTSQMFVSNNNIVLDSASNCIHGNTVIVNNITDICDCSRETSL